MLSVCDGDGVVRLGGLMSRAQSS